MKQEELKQANENLIRIMKEEGTYVTFMRLLRKGSQAKAQLMIEDVLMRRRKEVDGEESKP